MSIKGLFTSAAPPVPPFRMIAFSLIGTVLAIGVLSWLSLHSGETWLMAPFGASCVLAFGVPDSPLAQPRNIIGGHVIATLVGLVALHVLGDSWWVGAIAVGFALSLMQITRTLHAPAGANPLVVIAAHAPFSFLFTPVLTGSIVIVAIAWLTNNARSKNSYPRYWI
jgi:CBS-domain-containing membrane protein